jgi:hypothetical protein
MPAAARRVPFAGGTIPIFAPEHLAVCKAALDRTKDWLDVGAIHVATEPLDLAEIEFLLKRLVGPTDPRLTKLRTSSFVLTEQRTRARPDVCRRDLLRRQARLASG